jgi:small subunit ribosomal protein S16
MLKIRLQRTGKRRDPSYRLVVAEHARAAGAGKFVERVGTYNPKTKERALNADRIKYWISVGAQTSATVHNMLISAGITSGKKINVLPKKTVSKPEVTETESAAASGEAAEAAPAEAASEEAESVAA